MLTYTPLMSEHAAVLKQIFADFEGVEHNISRTFTEEDLSDLIGQLQQTRWTA